MIYLLKLSICLFIAHVSCILYVQDNERRFSDKLDGIWTFVMEVPNSDGIGLKENWHLRDLSRMENATVMPVPSAYNDLIPSQKVRDHVGWVWYQRTFYCWNHDPAFRKFLRFSSVNYHAVVFLNDKVVGNHSGGHLPFEIEVTGLVLFDAENRLTVAVNNTLSHQTIPPGEFVYNYKSNNSLLIPYSYFSEGINTDRFFKQKPNFDFFNYAGILRSVYLTMKPSSFIRDVEILAEMSGLLQYKIFLESVKCLPRVTVNIRDENGTIIARNLGEEFHGVLGNIKQWWPKGLGKPTLYEMEVLVHIDDALNDVYRLKFGFRTVTFSKNQVFVNGKPFYCHGFGMHEDFELHGRGYNPVVMIRDFNMLDWMSGNCYRTTHYPYSEERAHEADRRGIAVIAESPAVGMSVFTDENELTHAEMIKEMVERDRNHPSIIMWSIANEPKSAKVESREYFGKLINFTKQLDKARPITIAISTPWDLDNVADLLDVICINRYFGWYIDLGFPDVIYSDILRDLRNWRSLWNKPIIISEYGADSIPGLYQEPGRAFTEQYHIDLLKRTHTAFDELRKNFSIAGEMIWNFADFMTGESIIRPNGNHKGVLTRSRQTKMAAYVIKERYEKLLAETLIDAQYHR